MNVYAGIALQKIHSLFFNVLPENFDEMIFIIESGILLLFLVFILRWKVRFRTFANCL